MAAVEEEEEGLVVADDETSEIVVFKPSILDVENTNGAEAHSLQRGTGWGGEGRGGGQRMCATRKTPLVRMKKDLGDQGGDGMMYLKSPW